MTENKALDILNTFCNLLIDDGQVPEEVIEMLIDSGANASDLQAIGFSREQIADYAYYESMMSGESEEAILSELYS